MFVYTFFGIFSLSLVVGHVEIPFENCTGFKVFAFYDELGCVPGIVEDNCPITFNCSHFRDRAPGKCHYMNNTIEVGEVLEMTGLDSCISECYCENKSGNIDFECAYYDCFDKGPPSDNCYTMNSLNDCCNDNYICDSEDRATCNYLGKTYQEGDDFVTKNKDFHCVCTKDFEEDIPAQENKNCVPFHCGLELNHESELQLGCLPIFKDSLTCPWLWHCPNVQTDVYKSDGSERVCHFGNQTLPIGDVLKHDTKLNMDCTCVVPPMMQCIEYQL